MILKTNLTEKDITKIADNLGFAFNNFYLIRKSKNNQNVFRISLKHKDSVKNKTKYVRKGFYRNKINNVCLHGYTKFMIEILKRDKKAVFQSKFGKINLENIKEKFEELEYLNIGSIYNIVYYGDFCHCNNKTIENIYNSLNQLEE